MIKASRLKKLMHPAYWLRVWRAGAFDRMHGTNTRFRFASLEIPRLRSSLGDNEGHTTYKQPDDVARAIEALPLVDYSEWTFLDAGCGKGRFVLLAAAYPFKQVVGVELDPAVAAMAERNLQLYSGAPELRSDVTIQCADVASCDLPAGNLLIYMYNPFGPKTLRALVERAIGAADRRVIILYVKPVHHAVLDAIAGLHNRTAEWMSPAVSRDTTLMIWERPLADP